MHLSSMLFLINSFFKNTIDVCMRVVRGDGRKGGNDRGVGNIAAPPLHQCQEEPSEPGGTVALCNPFYRVCRGGEEGRQTQEFGSKPMGGWLELHYF